MRNRFDQLGKELALKALQRVGVTDAQYALNAETAFADLRHEPGLGAERERQQLGLLGELVRMPCLIELYSQAPGANELRGCLAKHIAYMQERARAARCGGRPPDPVWIWIVSAGVPRTLLSELAFRPMAGERRGVYVLEGDVRRIGIRLGLVVASELPVDTSTLLVRIMAGGRQLVTAVREVAALPVTAYERIVAEPVLLDFQHTLERDTSQLDPEEREFIMVMHKSWEDARAEGRAEARADTLRRLLVLKFGEVSPDLEGRIRTASPEEIDRFLERILFADSIDAVFT